MKKCLRIFDMLILAGDYMSADARRAWMRKRSSDKEEHDCQMSLQAFSFADVWSEIYLT